jgi:hypothetical protein
MTGTRTVLRRLRRAAPAMWIAVAGALGAAATAVGAANAVQSERLTAWNSATAICAGTQVLTRPSARDAYVAQDSPNQNYSTVSDLFVTSKSGSQNRRSLISFTLPTTPHGCTLTAAELRIWNPSGVAGRTIDVYRANATWTEAGLTWNNQPATTGTAVGAPSSGSSGWRTWGVLDHVQSMYSTGVNHGFVIRDRTENAATSPEQKYQARDGSPNDPELVLTFQ